MTGLLDKLKRGARFLRPEPAPVPSDEHDEHTVAIGETVPCAYCQRPVVKRKLNQRFCSRNHGGLYHYYRHRDERLANRNKRRLESPDPERDRRLVQDAHRRMNIARRLMWQAASPRTRARFLAKARAKLESPDAA